MNVVIVSDDVELGEKVRLLIVEEGFDCPSSSILPLNKAVMVLTKEKPDLIAAVLEPNPERTLGVILTIKGQCPVHVLAIGPATRYQARAARAAGRRRRLCRFSVRGKRVEGSSAAMEKQGRERDGDGEGHQLDLSQRRVRRQHTRDEPGRVAFPA